MSDWQEVTWIEAANAFAAGTHDVETLATARDHWTAAKGFWPDGVSLYRIREKPPLISMRIPTAVSREIVYASHRVTLRFASEADAIEAYGAINAAMNQPLAKPVGETT